MKKVDWREETLEHVRGLILEADPDMIEERKWRKPSNRMAGIPVWSHHGIVCTGETYKNYVKLTFKTLVRAAVALNDAPARTTRPVRLLSGGNPQIVKGEGDAPVQAYIAAMPSSRRELDEAQMAKWVRQAAALPGWKP